MEVARWVGCSAATRHRRSPPGPRRPHPGPRQGNDTGTQYRSAIHCHSPRQQKAAEASREAYQKVLKVAGYGHITTELASAAPFYFAEEYHQQYLLKVPNGYCGIGGTGVSCPVGVAPAGE